MNAIWLWNENKRELEMICKIKKSEKNKMQTFCQMLHRCTQGEAGGGPGRYRKDPIWYFFQKLVNKNGKSLNFSNPKVPYAKFTKNLKYPLPEFWTLKRRDVSKISSDFYLFHFEMPELNCHLKNSAALPDWFLFAK